MKNSSSTYVAALFVNETQLLFIYNILIGIGGHVLIINSKYSDC